MAENIKGLIDATTRVQSSSENTARSVERSRADLESKRKCVANLMRDKRSANDAVGAMTMAEGSLAAAAKTLHELEKVCGEYIAYLRS